MTNTEHTPPPPPRSYPRAKFVSAEIRGGVLIPAAPPEPNAFSEAAYTIRLDDQPQRFAPLSMAIWLRLELTPDERRQWAHTLLEGL